MSRITAAGPAPNRPPHSELESGLRVVIVTLLLAGLTACGDAGSDKGKPETPQPAAKTDAPGAKLGVIDRSHAGEAAPTVMFEARSGKSTSLADFRDRPVLVNLWATWCVPCIKEMPELDALAAGQGARLAVLPISQDLEGWGAVDKFFAKSAFKSLVPYLDQPGNFAMKMDARGLPLSILYGADGRERWRVAGPLKWTSPQVVASL